MLSDLSSRTRLIFYKYCCVCVRVSSVLSIFLLSRFVSIWYIILRNLYFIFVFRHTFLQYLFQFYCFLFDFQKYQTLIHWMCPNTVTCLSRMFNYSFSVYRVIYLPVYCICKYSFYVCYFVCILSNGLTMNHFILNLSLKKTETKLHCDHF